MRTAAVTLQRGFSSRLDGKKVCQGQCISADGDVADALGEFGLSGVESSDGHQVAAENFVAFGVLDVELEGFREGLNRFRRACVREQRVSESVPTPGGISGASLT